MQPQQSFNLDDDNLDDPSKKNGSHDSNAGGSAVDPKVAKKLKIKQKEELKKKKKEL